MVRASESALGARAIESYASIACYASVRDGPAVALPPPNAVMARVCRWCKGCTIRTRGASMARCIWYTYGMRVVFRCAHAK